MQLLRSPDYERKELSMTEDIPTTEAKGFNFTLDDFSKWVNAAGFKRVDLLPLAGSSNAAIAYK